MLPQITRISTDLYNPQHVGIKPAKSDDEPAPRYPQHAIAFRALDGGFESACKGTTACRGRDSLRLHASRFHSGYAAVCRPGGRCLPDLVDTFAPDDCDRSTRRARALAWWWRRGGVGWSDCTARRQTTTQADPARADVKHGSSENSARPE